MVSVVMQRNWYRCSAMIRSDLGRFGLLQAKSYRVVAYTTTGTDDIYVILNKKDSSYIYETSKKLLLT